MSQSRKVAMFDHAKFMSSNFRDADGLIGLFSVYRVAIPSKDTVRKWFERGSIPSEWFVMAVCVLELDRGEPVSLIEYLKGETAHV